MISLRIVLQIYKKYIHDIDEKEKKLREVVGDSYRDLISSADAIGSIAEQCQTVSEKLEALLGMISHSSELSNIEDDDLDRGYLAGSSPREVERRLTKVLDDEIFHVSRSVKFIVDSQEAIYGHIDRNEFYLAALRHLKAVSLHKELEKSQEKKQYMKQFPFLEHLWPSIRKLDGEIWNKGQLWISKENKIDLDGVISVLGCFALLRPTDGMDLLKYLLSSRRDNIVNRIESISMDERLNDLSEISSLVGQSIMELWYTVSLVLNIFSDSGSKPLQNLLRESLRDADLSGSDTKYNRSYISRINDIASKLDDSISNSLLQLETEDWLSKTSYDLKTVLNPIVSHIGACRDLKQIESDVREMLDGMLCAIHTEGELKDLSVSRISQHATGKIIDVWEWTCQDPITNRAKTLIKKKLDLIDDLVGKEMIPDIISQSTRDPITLENPLEPSVPEYSNKNWWMHLSETYFKQLDSILKDVLGDSLECLGIEDSKSRSSDGHIDFKNFVTSEFASSISSMVAKLTEATLSSSKKEVKAGICLTIVQFSSLLLGACMPFTQFLHFQEIARQKELVPPEKFSELQMHPWARETLKKVSDLRQTANKAWASWVSTAIWEKMCSETNIQKTKTVSDENASVCVPTSPSYWLIGAFTYFCESIDQAGGSDMGEDLVKQAMNLFKATMLATLIDSKLYSSADSSFDKNWSLQRIYDIRFAHGVFLEETSMDQSAKLTLKELISNIDPVEWDEYDITIKRNIANFLANAGIFLHMSTHGTSLSSNSDTEMDSVLPLATSSARFTYLPAKLPSRSEKVHSYNISATVDAEDMTGHQTPTASAQSAISSLIGSKAAEMSHSLLSFNFPSFTD